MVPGSTLHPHDECVERLTHTYFDIQLILMGISEKGVAVRFSSRDARESREKRPSFLLLLLQLTSASTLRHK